MFDQLMKGMIAKKGLKHEIAGDKGIIFSREMMKQIGTTKADLLRMITMFNGMSEEEFASQVDHQQLMIKRDFGKYVKKTNKSHPSSSDTCIIL